MCSNTNASCVVLTSVTLVSRVPGLANKEVAGGMQCLGLAFARDVPRGEVGYVHNKYRIFVSLVWEFASWERERSGNFSLCFGLGINTWTTMPP
jgi:hypothetical protein